MERAYITTLFMILSMKKFKSNKEKKKENRKQKFKSKQKTYF